MKPEVTARGTCGERAGAFETHRRVLSGKEDRVGGAEHRGEVGSTELVGELDKAALADVEAELFVLGVDGVDLGVKERADGAFDVGFAFGARRAMPNFHVRKWQKTFDKSGAGLGDDREQEIEAFRFWLSTAALATLPAQLAWGAGGAEETIASMAAALRPRRHR